MDSLISRFTYCSQRGEPRNGFLVPAELFELSPVAVDLLADGPVITVKSHRLSPQINLALPTVPPQPSLLLWNFLMEPRELWYYLPTVLPMLPILHLLHLLQQHCGIVTQCVSLFVLLLTYYIII